MIGASRQAVVFLVAVAAIAVPERAGAQTRAASRPPEPATFLVTAASASAGAVAGFAVAATFARPDPRYCPAVPGAHCGGGEGSVLVLAGSTLFAAATGAYLGARMLGRRPNFFRSTVGAGLGLLVGGALATALDADSDIALAVSFVVPTGILASLVGR